jgi:hypothetical protein
LKKLSSIYLNNRFLYSKSIKISFLLLTILGIAIYFPINNQALAKTEVITQTIAKKINTTDKPLQLKNIRKIKTGTFFGHCVGYCNQEFIITPKKIIYTKTANSSDLSKNPDVVKEISISRAEWQNLVQSIDADKFTALPDTIGCPDCADGGGEWIEISNRHASKKIVFEYNQSVPEIKSLVKKLRNLRNQVTSTK